MFVNDSINYAANNPLTMVLITDGQPYPSQYNPCNAPNQKNELDYNGIETHIVGSGNFNANVLACLVDDASTQIHGIADSNSTDFKQGFVLNAIAMPAPATFVILGFAVADIAAARRRP